MLTSSPFYSLAGKVWIQIQSGALSGTLEILDLDTINYEYDLMPSDQDIVAIGGMPGASSIVFDDRISTGQSVYSSLISALGNYSGFSTLEAPKMLATIYLQPPSQSFQYTFPFEFRAQDLSYDERSKRTTISLMSRTSNLNVGTWAANVTNHFPSKMSFESGETFFTNSWASGDFIYDVISELDTSTGNTTIYKSGDIGASYSLTNAIYVFERLTDILNSPTNIEVSDYSSLMFVHDTPMYFANSNSVYQKVQAFAGMEGAIFGSAFGINFYVNRTVNIYNVEITKDDIVDIKFIPQNRDIKSTTLSFVNTTATDTPDVFIGYDLPKITNATGGVPGWLAGSRNITASISGFYPQLNRGVYDATENYVNGDSDTLAFYNDQKTARFASDIYSKASGASLQQLYRIDADIMGVDKIKPHEVIKFDNTLSNIYTDKHFRPTSIAYDLKADMVSVTAYQIDFIPSPLITTTTTTGAPTTTTTTLALPPFNNLGVGVDSADACADWPGGVTLYGNAYTFAASTLFYSNEARTTLYLGGNLFYSDGVNVHRINNSGASTLYELCAGVTTTTTTSTTSTTTTAAPTTTTTTSTSTTTTTAAFTQFTLLSSGASSAAACSAYPGSTTLYGNNPVFQSATKFYTDAGGTTPFDGVDLYYSNGSHAVQINSSGDVTATATCPTTTTTTTTSTTTTTTTSALTEFGFITNGSTVSGAQACLNWPGYNTFYGNNPSFQSCTVLYSDAGGEFPIFGGNKWYSNGTHSLQIDNSGVVVSVHTCVATTTTTTTTTTTSTTTTTTTTLALTPFTSLSADASVMDACSNYPASITIYGNASLFGDCTQFFDDAGGLSPTNGFDYWYTNGDIALQIDTNGNVIDTDIC